MSRHEQIAAFVLAAITNGSARPGTRLPSSRMLAVDLGVSRQTAVLAYETLLAEGYAVSRAGAGIFVSSSPPERGLPPPDAAPTDAAPTDAARIGASHTDVTRDAPAPVLSRRGAALSTLVLSPARREPGLLTPGILALDFFPYATWSKLTARFWRSRPGQDQLGYTDPAGLMSLRQAIADHLGATRGLPCRAADVIVTAGSQGAIALAAGLLLDDGDAAWVEEPAYVAGRSALAAAGARLVPVDVDADGLDVAAGIRAAPAARLALITPSHQYPTGVTMSQARRVEMLRWAEAANAWIIEDDYDGDYRYGGRPLRPLRAMASHGADRRVVYVGTFAKVLAPALRLGFLLAPTGLGPAFATGRALVDRQPPLPLQAVLADFIGEGHLSAHLRRMRLLYAERRDALLGALDAECRGLLAWRPEDVDAGLHLAVRFQDPTVDDAAVSAAAARLGVEAPPLSSYSLGRGQAGLVLGFSATPAERMVEAARRLSRAARSIVGV